MKNTAILFLLTVSIAVQAQVVSDSADNRLLGAYYFFRKDYKTALYYFAMPARASSYDLALELETLLLSGEEDKASIKLLEQCAAGQLDTSDVFASPALAAFVAKNRLRAKITETFDRGAADFLEMEIYHLTQVDQLVRFGLIDDKSWIAIDTAYILPRLIAYLDQLIECPTPHPRQHKGLSTILLHQARYPNGYELISQYLEKLRQSGILGPLDYAKTIDSYLLVNNQGVQKYGTIIIPRGNTGYVQVTDPENIDATRNSIRLPPLGMAYDFVRLDLDLPDWYTQLKAHKKK